MVTSTSTKPLPFWMKLVYGSGDFARASYNTLRMFFYAIFLTDVVGLNPFLASGATFLAILWDAVNDPLVGVISDKIRTRWGRRRPFLLWFAIPFGLSFMLLWWAPPWKSQIMLAIHIMLAYMIADTFQTLVTVPYMALTPELAPDYDERTSLMTVRMTFNLAASLVAAGLGPTILDAVLQAGLTQQQGYLILGALFGGAAVIPFLLMFALIKERPLLDQPKEQAFNLKDTVRQLWQNKPFRYAGGIYVLNWVSFDLLALMLPYFLLYWMASGNLLARVNLFGLSLSAETAVFGVLLITATLSLPFWNYVSKHTSKRRTYIIGMSLWIGVQILIWTMQPGNMVNVLWVAVLAGIMTSNAHVIPESIFPDVIDWDEVIHHERREGLYYGAINFIRKLSSALATFIALQVLGWSGYQAPPLGATQFTQSPQALTAIRILASPAVIILLLAAIAFAWLFPLSRDRQQRIQRRLLRRQKRTAHE